MSQRRGTFFYGAQALYVLLQLHKLEPDIRVPNQLVGAPPTKEVVLECFVESSPRSVNYWTRENGDMIISSSKYEVIEEADSYLMHFKLKIRDLEEKDFGAYNCISKNLLGEAEGQIRLHEIDLATVKIRVETKESHATADGIEETLLKKVACRKATKQQDLVSTNLTLANQKALDSYQHSLVNQIDDPQKEKAKLSSRPVKGDDATDHKYSEILKHPEEKTASENSGARASGCSSLQLFPVFASLAASLLI